MNSKDRQKKDLMNAFELGCKDTYKTDLDPLGGTVLLKLALTSIMTNLKISMQLKRLYFTHSKQLIMIGLTTKYGGYIE